MKMYFIETESYSSGISHKGKRLQELVGPYFRSIAFSEKTLEHIVDHIKRMAKSLDEEFPRTKPFYFTSFKTVEHMRFAVYMNSRDSAPLCLVIHATEIFHFYDSAIEPGLQDCLKNRILLGDEQHERER